MAGENEKCDNKFLPGEVLKQISGRESSNLMSGHFMLLFGRARWRNVPKFLTDVQGLCFSSKSYCSVTGSRCRLRSSF